MKHSFVVISIVIMFAACTHKHSVAPLLVENDLSYLVINPDSVPTDGMYSWWTDSFKAQWNSHDPSLEYQREPFMDDEWLYRVEPLGFRGNNYQRFYIHFDNVYKVSPTLYRINGRTRCKDEICTISGTIAIDSIRTDMMEIEEFNFIQLSDAGTIFAHFDFDAAQDILVAHLFGTVTYDYLVHNDTAYYDALSYIGDGYCNNQYRGKWVDLATSDTLVCNWGDYRIPDSDEFDTGCGEFVPNEKYYNYGWQTYRDRYRYWVKDTVMQHYYDSIYIADENWWKK